jgi:hypothetical protein
MFPNDYFKIVEIFPVLIGNNEEWKPKPVSIVTKEHQLKKI